MSEIQDLLTVVRAREERIDQQIAELRGLAGMAGPRHGGNVRQIMVTPPTSGERGIWLVVLCALLMVAINVMQLVDRMRQDNEIRELREADRDHDNHLSAIYMMAPHLKPDDKPK